MSVEAKLRTEEGNSHNKKKTPVSTLANENAIFPLRLIPDCLFEVSSILVVN